MVDAEAARLTARITREGQEDRVALEEPLEIRVDGAPLAVTMRTPGHDEELALGFLYGEGLIDGPRRAGLTEDLAANVVEVEGPLLRDPGERRFYTTSSCGVCGKGALEEVAVQCPIVAPGPVVARELLAALPDRLRQPAFDLTGGVHATGLFDVSGELQFAREDVGRLSFELVQKAAVAGAPVLVGVGAPSSLAVALAADRGLTLAGFARRGKVNVYTGLERLAR
jgi:FdhD protein